MALRTYILAAPLLAAISLNAQVTFDRLLHADKEPQNWLTYGGHLQQPALQHSIADQS